MRIRSIAVASALAAGIGAFTFAGPASAAYAPALCGAAYMTPVLVNNQYVEVSGEIACSDPGNPRDGTPLPVTLQKLSGSAWVTVATGAGDAIHVCTGTLSHTYRLFQRPSVVVHLPCI